ncbi:unnamed protein product [Bursaphelenchus xylophilus]|uniref:(pine wood nematode) hypothetical protein n=1 Tax=Bursaphelenchus xylophilus TaxID=6326 RepID=A0A1I7SBC2_BURXY|nr:unnamed protein product [Bursaphelenchus xylophilus]CAG9131972.1 unnamed protein product [Bursaphelenchus xylophilus]
MLELCLTPIDFYYRYQTICLNKTLSNRRLYSIVAFVYSITFVHAFPVYQSFAKYGPANDTRIAAEALWKLEEFEDKPSFSYNSYRDIMSYVNLLTLMTMFAVGYFVIFWAYIRIHTTVKKHVNYNQFSALASMEQQINKVILVQMIVPFFGNGIPVSVVSVTSMLHIDFHQFSIFYHISVGWIAALKPLITISLIPSYRRRIYEILGLRESVGKSKTAAIGSTIGMITTITSNLATE